MEAKEKAKELYHYYSNLLEPLLNGNRAFLQSRVKQCALIAVDEILDATKGKALNPKWTEEGQEKWEVVFVSPYWQEVKQEIDKL